MEYDERDAAWLFKLNNLRGKVKGRDEMIIRRLTYAFQAAQTLPENSFPRTLIVQEIEIAVEILSKGIKE